MAEKKQAVVVIHGMGEQVPMQTIRDFVEAVWKTDPNLQNPTYWNKPSRVSQSFEQRRLTTNTPKLFDKKINVNQRTDFYEYYWAHQTVGTRWQHFTGWIAELMWCLPCKYHEHPNSIQRLWVLMWSLLFVALTSMIMWGKFVHSNLPSGESVLLISLVTIFEATLLFMLNKARKFFTEYFGDVARYVRAKPENVQIRQAIREGGIELLERIQQTGNYDRIILVGHSLGSIIAYDILNHLWARNNKFKDPENEYQATPLSSQCIEIIEELELLAKDSGSVNFRQDEYRALQYQLFEELRKDELRCNWIISDFVTLGSPLTYADFLLFQNEQQFKDRKLDREYPLSPPIRDQDHFYYGLKNEKFLHHAAVFAPVRWSNIYISHSCIYKGDIISGPVSKNFSYKYSVNQNEINEPDDIYQTPIKEIKLKWSEIHHGFCHTRYWSSEKTSAIQIQKLRELLSLYR
ncbi:hypothetical protein ABRP92_14835 [Pectobacterium aroidearum]|uniref:hypothetical protein n=1 Tax=Pectobacterium aroidearum TaxID=1201031 RepID=UPI0032EBD75C